MKASLKSLPLLVAASLPGVAFCQFFGVDVPAVLNFETASVVFTLVLLGLTCGDDYSQRARRLTARGSSAVSNRAETHRLAA